MRWGTNLTTKAVTSQPFVAKFDSIGGRCLGFTEAYPVRDGSGLLDFFAVPATGELVAGGVFDSPTQFGPITLSPRANPSIFIARTGVATGLAPEAAGAGALHVWPNPATDQVRVRVPATLRGEALTLTLHDGLGRVVRRQAVAPGVDTAVAVAGLAAGLYSIRVQGGKRVLHARLMVQPQ